LHDVIRESSMMPEKSGRNISMHEEKMEMSGISEEKGLKSEEVRLTIVEYGMKSWMSVGEKVKNVISEELEIDNVMPREK